MHGKTVKYIRLVVSRPRFKPRTCISLNGIAVYSAVWSIIFVFESTIQEEIKSRLKLGNACYCSVQNLWPSILVSKNINIVFVGVKLGRSH